MANTTGKRKVWAWVFRWGPTFANIFMCFNEKFWLDECPDEFKPVFYRRYIDDTFVLFRHQSHPAVSELFEL